MIWANYMMYLDVIARYGEKHQMEKTIEELGELVVAIKHYLAGKEPISAVIEEMADVTIMLDQLEIITGLAVPGDTFDTKLKREVTRKLTKLKKHVELDNELERKTRQVSWSK